jgi:hypothetical protein
MASHFKWYPGSEDRVIPWNATYQFPSQANKAEKTTPRITPKNGSVFNPSNTIRVEFPAQGYTNTSHLTFEFDVNLILPVDTTQPGLSWEVKFQQNIQSIFERGRLLYGSTVLEDLIDLKNIVRLLTDTTTSNDAVFDQTSIGQGIAGYSASVEGDGELANQGYINNRLYTHGIVNAQNNATGYNQQMTNGIRMYPGGTAVTNGPVTTYTATRRYQITLPIGLFVQKKLIPQKWMASQLAVELTLATPQDCIIALPYTTPADDVQLPLIFTPTYTVTNFNMIPEFLNFDQSYDAFFLDGLKKGGIPIQYSSWHTFLFSQNQSSSANLIIQEKSRSVKAIFAVIQLQDSSFRDDNGATFAGLSVSGGTDTTLDSYQFRIGGRYYPASPVICSGWESNTGAHNGAVEAFIELQKALGTLGDARLSTATNASRWARSLVPLNLRLPLGVGLPAGTTATDFPSFQNSSDFKFGVNQNAIALTGGYAEATPSANGYCATDGSSIFVMSTQLETTNGLEISGLNAEEQSDISLNIKWAGAPNAGGKKFNIKVFTYYDGMLVLRENNVIERIV